MQIAAVATEAPGPEVGRFQRAELDQIGLLVEAVIEDLLDAAVGRRAEVQSPATGGFEPLGAVALTQAQQALRGAQVIEDAVAEQAFDYRTAGGPDALGLLQTPLRVAHHEGHGIGRHMFGDGGFGAGLEQPRMHGDELVIAVDTQRTRGDLQPQLLPD